MQVFRNCIAEQIGEVINVYSPRRNRLSKKDRGYLDALIRCYELLKPEKQIRSNVQVYLIIAFFIFLLHIVMHPEHFCFLNPF